MQGMPTSWPLVGREDELDFIAQAMDRPGAPGVVVAGVAGVGKTRLLAEAIIRAGDRGRPTATAQGSHSARAIPFGALAHLLPLDLSATGPTNLLRVAADALTEGLGSDRLVLAIDDAHLLDETSAALAHHVAESRRCFVIASLRSGELAPDAVVALWKDDLADRLEIQPLSRDEVDRLLKGVLEGPIDGATSHHLWETTEGNALFLRELVLGGLTSGTLAQRSGLWMLRGNLGEVPRLVDVVETRLGDVTPEERGVLEIVGLGEPLETSFLEALSDRRAIGSVERRHLLVTRLNGRRRQTLMHHPLFGEATRARTPPSTATTLKARLAEMLQEAGARRRGDILRLASWRLESGGLAESDLFLAAAHRAMALFHHDLAERLARAVFDADRSVPAGFALAEALSGQGRDDAAEDLLGELERASMSEAERTRVVSTRASNLFWRLGRGAEAEAVIRSTLPQLQDAQGRDDLLCELADVLIAGRSVEEGRQAAFEVLDRRVAGDRPLLIAATAGAFAATFAGRTAEALATVGRWSQLARERTDELPLAPIWLGLTRCNALLAAGRISEACAEAEVLYEGSARPGAELLRGPQLFFLGWVTLMAGRIESARAWNREAVAVLREVDFRRHRSSTLGDLAHCEALLGNDSKAERVLLEARALRVPSFMLDEGFIGRAETWLAAARGEVSRGIASAIRAADTIGAMGQSFPESLSLHDVVRLGEPARVVDRLTELAEFCDGELIPAFARHAAALTADDADGLVAVASAFEQMGAILYGAEAAAQAARIYRDEGRTGSAFAASAQARSLADRCEGARTPALSDIGGSLPLTRREREIASLAARGMTNREIAERLVVSVRTVDNHLHSAYTKLGVAGRDQLSSILDPVARVESVAEE